MFRHVMTAVGVMAVASSASAAYLTNGDLETLDAGTPVFTGWSNNAGTSIATQAIEGNYSARIERETANNGNALNQNFNDPDGDLSVFRISLDFAASDPGSSTSRSLQFNVRTLQNPNDGNVGSINLRIVRGSAEGLGTVQVLNGSTFVSVLTDAVTLASSESGDGFVVNSLSIDADYTTSPSYTVTANGVTTDSLSYFQTTAPSAGTAVKQLSFQSGNVVTGAWAVVDNISVVPEPAAASLLGVAGLLALRRRRTA